MGSVEPDPHTRLAMVALAGQHEVSLELVQRANGDRVDPSGLDHLAVQVDDVVALRAALVAAGLRPGEVASPVARTVRTPCRSTTRPGTTSSSWSGPRSIRRT